MSTQYEEGRRYRVIFNDGTRHHKQVVLKFICQDNGEYVFDRGPLNPWRIGVTDVISAIETQLPISPTPSRVGTLR